jgi:hypothetical protein
MILATQHRMDNFSMATQMEQQTSSVQREDRQNIFGDLSAYQSREDYLLDKKEETSLCQERHSVDIKPEEEVNSDAFDIEGTKFFQEAADLLTPFYMAIDAANSDSDAAYPPSEDMSDKMMSITETGKAFKSSKRKDLQANKIMDFSCYAPKEEQLNCGRTSVIRLQSDAPEMSFTSEELCCIKAQEKVQKSNLLNTARQDLFEARVQNYFGQLSHEGMLMTVASGRKAQNYYHYLTMISLPFFEDLSEK